MKLKKGMLILNTDNQIYKITKVTANHVMFKRIYGKDQRYVDSFYNVVYDTILAINTKEWRVLDNELDKKLFM